MVTVLLLVKSKCLFFKVKQSVVKFLLYFLVNYLRCRKDARAAWSEDPRLPRVVCHRIASGLYLTFSLLSICLKVEPPTSTYPKILSSKLIDIYSHCCCQLCFYTRSTLLFNSSHTVCSVSPGSYWCNFKDRHSTCAVAD